VAELERCPHCGACIEIYARSCPACGRSVVEEKIAVFRRQPWVSDDVFGEIVRLLREPEPAEPPSVPPIRKQIADLLPSDLEQYAIWELALDEEGEEGQDEETVRPRPDLRHADPADGLFVVRAELVARDGTRFTGFVTASEEDALSALQPTIVTARGQVRFWLGLHGPRPGEIEDAYELLAKPAGRLFPLRFRTLVPVAGRTPAGAIGAFLRLRSSSDHGVVELR
jgi:hypothetical protein